MYGESEFLHGIHDGHYGEALALMADKPGWVLMTHELGADPSHKTGHDYRPMADRGYGVIARLNHGYGTVGTIPLPDKYAAFAQRCANWVAGSAGCHIWQIGNEMNHAQERPQGRMISAEDYVRCFQLARDAIRAVPGHAQDQIAPGAVAPYNADSGPWVPYFRTIVERTRPNALVLHAYTHGPDAALVTSEKRMDPPYQDMHFEFRTYRDFLAAVPADLRHVPCYIGECNQDRPWVDEDNGWMEALFEEVAAWNRSGGQVIRAVVLYRWRGDVWAWDRKGNVQRAFRRVVERGYRWPAQVQPVVESKERAALREIRRLADEALL